MNGKKLDFDTREKRLVMCGIFALLLLLPFMAAVPGVLAKVADDIEDMLVKDITSMSGGIGTEIKTILLETKLSSSVTDAFSTGVKGVANVLFIFYMYCSLISEVQKGDPEMGMWLRFFCKVYVGFWCIENSGTLITIIQGLGEDVMNGVTLSTATAADIESKARTALDGVFTKPNGNKIGTIPAAVIFIRALPVILAGKVAVVAEGIPPHCSVQYLRRRTPESGRKVRQDLFCGLHPHGNGHPDRELHGLFLYGSLQQPAGFRHHCSHRFPHQRGRCHVGRDRDHDADQ